MAEEKLMRFYDDRFEIIARARKHIIEATNIEMSPKEMEVLDNFLFRCWQMGWLKNDYKELEKENAELKERVEKLELLTEQYDKLCWELDAMLEKLEGKQ